MTEQEKKWFEKLAKKRENFAKELNDPDHKGIKDFVIKGIYSDQAHFIYELLQNADDAQATEARFLLTNDGLYLIHNGKINFNITDIDDRTHNGHINAITAIGRSGKTNEAGYSIGKFGIGFKAVFKYTETPYIYDPKFLFKIYDLIIPELLKDNLPNFIKYNQKEDTVFYFPFNRHDLPAEKAYSDILKKLKFLEYPTLFLRNLELVEWSVKDNEEKGEYLKIAKTDVENNYNISYQLFDVFNNDNIEKIWLLSRQIEIDGKNLPITVGYFVENGKLKKNENSKAFCFFPTQKETKLGFIIHAPFLLTSSREGIPVEYDKEDEYYSNKLLIDYLSELSADSLLVLRDLKLVDDNIVNIIPYKERDFFGKKITEKYLFYPFFEKTKEKFKTEELFPSKDGTFVSGKNAYLSEYRELCNLFSNEQLSQLEGANAKWIFPSIQWHDYSDKELVRYLSGIIKKRIYPNNLFNNIDVKFILRQCKIDGELTFDWLRQLYDYCLEKRPSDKEFVKTRPIFIDCNGNAVAVFEKSKEGEYRQIREMTDIHDEIVNKSSDFLRALGMQEQKPIDKAFKKISESHELYNHFIELFEIWKENGQPTQIINDIKNSEKPFVKINGSNTYDTANKIYYPTDKLKLYFEAKQGTKFVDLDFYAGLTNEVDLLESFLSKLDILTIPKIDQNDIDGEREQIKGNTKNTFQVTIKDKIIDGSEIFFQQIKTDNSKDKSILFWEFLCQYKNYSLFEGKKEIKVGSSPKIEEYRSSAIKLIQDSKWLYTRDERWVAPHEITIDELADGYERNTELERLLGFKQSVILTKEQSFAQIFDNVEEAKEAKRALEEKREKEKRKAERKISGTNREVDTDDLESAIESLDNISESVSKPKTEKEKTNTLPDFNEEEELAEAIDIAKQKIEIKKERQGLANSLKESEKYSYDWFKAYLQLLTTYGEKQDTQKQKSISFQEIKPYKTDNKYFLLCGASSYISPEIENANDFKITLVFGGGKKENINVEGVSKKGQDLLIYCREPLSSNTLSRLSNIFKVEINFTPVIDLLDRLKRAFENRKYIDEWENIEEAMPSLNYIYGPPGTGKTTTLCNNINEILATNPNAKFLVLTPTNKASDVVCKKLQDINPDIYAVRLSSPTDPELEEYQIYRDTLDIENMQRINVVASTIHRLPYFDVREVGLLFQHNWDYVIFDEASMTGLHYITFAIMALFKTNSNTKFIIAGDPKQIPPVVEIDEKELENFDFQDENIYKMMNLKSFNPEEQKIRETDSIVNLETQYRSIPQIGQLFSELSYSSLLKHDRATNREEAKQLPEKFRNLISSNVTFVDIPLNQDNSIYRVNKLFYSSYHTYCAILISEIIKYFDAENTDEQWTIGLIAPYKAQAMLLNKLITSYGISGNVKVISDTVHGFQGDECDIVFFVCNPNNYFFSNHEKALLSKEYIYNVAISRARDYLVILHPYTTIPNNKFINIIGTSYKNNFGNAKILRANDIEKTLFNDSNYIENNSYVSGHDNVNVFGLSEMKYFIKANDTAIDIQLREIKEHKINGLTTENNFAETEVAKNNSGLKIVGKIDLTKFEKYKKK